MQAHWPFNASLSHGSLTSSLDFANKLRERLLNEPELAYLEAYMKDPRMGNSVCNDRNKLSRNVIILERQKDEWCERIWEIGKQPWENNGNAKEYAIIANYLDIDFIQSVVEGLEIDLKAFRSHLNGCEQHYKGDWAISSFTSPPYPRSVYHQSRYACIDFRRPYLIKDEASFSAFSVSRKERCSLLRSHHRARTANVLFEHERCTIAWSPIGSEGSKRQFLAFKFRAHLLTRFSRRSTHTL